MNNKTYSTISQQLHLNLKDGNATCEDFLRHIAQSFEFVSQSPSDISNALHNKYVRLGKSKYGIEGISEYATTRGLKKLELDFEKDPSDMGVVMDLAIEYSAIGRQKRARQLLGRVSASGYPEREKAAKLIERLDAGEELK